MVRATVRGFQALGGCDEPGLDGGDLVGARPSSMAASTGRVHRKGQHRSVGRPRGIGGARWDRHPPHRRPHCALTHSMPDLGASGGSANTIALPGATAQRRDRPRLASALSFVRHGAQSASVGAVVRQRAHGRRAPAAASELRGGTLRRGAGACVVCRAGGRELALMLLCPRDEGLAHGVQRGAERVSEYSTCAGKRGTPSGTRARRARAGAALR